MTSTTPGRRRRERLGSGVRRRLGLLLAAVAVVVLGAAACGGGGDGGEPTTTLAAPVGDGQPLRLDAMPAAVAAIETQLGGAQRYFEVNATPNLVNLFVAGDGTATWYVYDAVAGELSDQADTQPASGDTFTWDQVEFDPDEVLTAALAQLPSALPRTFAVTAGAEGALQYLVSLESRQGGVLDVIVTGGGDVIGAQAR